MSKSTELVIRITNIGKITFVKTTNKIIKISSTLIVIWLSVLITACGSDGTNSENTETINTLFSARYSHEVVRFNDGSGDKLWLIGGLDGAHRNDVWSSSDGVTWIEEITNAAFSARNDHRVVSYNNGSGNKLWLIGGFDGVSKKNDVWSSSDGVTWIEETGNAAFSARQAHQVVTYNDGSGDKLWLIGGDDGTSTLPGNNDVWSSSDGSTWIEETTSATFSPRIDHQVVSFNNGSGDKLWLIGGFEIDAFMALTLTNDVWSTSDGVNWVEETSGAEFSARNEHQIVRFNNGSGDKLWLIGGNDGITKNDIWSSSDGVHWTEETTSASFSGRYDHRVVRFNNGDGDKLWLIGGYFGEYKNDIWFTSNGVDWQ